MYDVEQALADPLVEELGMLWEVDHPDLGRIREVGCPVRLSDTEPLPRRAAPQLGQHTDAVLRELLELPEDEIAELRDTGVI